MMEEILIYSDLHTVKSLYSLFTMVYRSWRERERERSTICVFDKIIWCYQFANLQSIIIIFFYVHVIQYILHVFSFQSESILKICTKRGLILFASHSSDLYLRVFSIESLKIWKPEREFKYHFIKVGIWWVPQMKLNHWHIDKCLFSIP